MGSHGPGESHGVTGLASGGRGRRKAERLNQPARVSLRTRATPATAPPDQKKPGGNTEYVEGGFTEKGRS